VADAGVPREGVLRPDSRTPLSRKRVIPVTAEIPLQASNKCSRNSCGVLQFFDNPFNQ